MTLSLFQHELSRTNKTMIMLPGGEFFFMSRHLTELTSVTDGRTELQEHTLRFTIALCNKKAIRLYATFFAFTKLYT